MVSMFSGFIATIAGVPGVCGYNGDGILATAAFLNYPFHATIDNRGGLFISDTNNYALRYGMFILCLY